MRQRGIVFIHPANESRRSVVQGHWLKREGMQPGVPDYLILTGPRMKSLNLPGVAIELKRKVGGRITTTQQEWLDRLEKIGWHAFVARGADEAIAKLKECF